MINKVDKTEGGENLERLQISLAAARVNAEMTQDEVADAMNISKNTVVNWEKGRTEIKPHELAYLSKMYNMPEEFIRVPIVTTTG